MDNKTFIYFGVIIALIIAVAAPYIASSDPDGLESAFFGIYGAKETMGDELNEDMAGNAEEEVVEVTGNSFEFESPFPDYSIEGLLTSGESLAIVIGTLLVLAIAFGLGKVLARTE